MQVQFNFEKHFYFKLFSLVKQFLSMYSFNVKKTVPFQTIYFSISTQFKCKYSVIVKNISIQAIQFGQTVLIQIIQFSISIQLVLLNP